MREDRAVRRPRASIVIPTWNGQDLLLHAMRSLASQSWRDFETVVVDNGSTDDTVARLRVEHPAARIVQLPANQGFAAAVNAGIRAAAGEIIVLMNNDTEAAPDWLKALVAALDDNPDVAVCASRMIDFHDRTRIDSVGVQFGLFASNIGQRQLDGPQFARQCDVFGACAGAAAYRRRVLDQVGLFDESFFAYFEDVDLAARIQLAGHRCLYVPDAVIYHHGSATADRMADTKFYLLMRNALTLFFRYAPPRRLLWAPVVLAWPFARALIDRQPPRLALRALWDFLLNVPDIMFTRRQLNATRTISDADFHRRLASPLTRAARAPVSVHRGRIGTFERRN